MKKKTLLEALLLEHVNVTGADYIGTVDDIDLFRIRTWAAAQEFVCAGTTTLAGEKWCQNEGTFNRNINETTKLYFFVNRDTYAVVLGAISSDSMSSFTYQGQTYAANYMLEDTSGRNNCSVDLTILNLLPDFVLEEPSIETAVQNAEENVGENDNIEDTITGDSAVEDEINFDEEEDASVSNNVSSTEEKNEEPSDERTNSDALKIRIVGNHAEVVGCAQVPHPDQLIDIPETYQGKPVTKIAPFAFYKIKADGINAPYIQEIAPKAVVNCQQLVNDASGINFFIQVPVHAKSYYSSVIFDGKNVTNFCVKRRY